MRIHFRLVVAAFLVAAPLAAEEACPLVMHTGTWIGNTAGDTVLFRDGKPVQRKRDASGPQMIAITGDVCKRQIKVDFAGIPFDMSPVGSTETGDAFIGSSSNATIDAELALEVVSPRLAGGEISTGTIVKGGLAGMKTPLEFRYETDAEKHPACTCQTPLKAFIDLEVKGREFWRDVYADPSLRQKPPGLPPDLNYGGANTKRNWNSITYDRLITLIHNGNLAYEEAIEHLATEITTAGDLVEKPVTYVDPETNSTTTKDVEALTDAETSLFDCDPMHFDSESEGCYPDVARAADAAHEAVHQAACLQRNGPGGKKTEAYEVDNLGDEEIAAYDAGIGFLRSWIADNCG